MGALKDYDDMMGYEFGEFDAWFDVELLKELAVAGGAGGAAIFAGSWTTKKIASFLASSNIEFLKSMSTANRSRLVGAIAILLGVGGGSVLARYNRDAAFGVAAALGGLGIAQIAGTFISTSPVGTPLGEMDDDGEGLLSDYDYNTINGLAEAAVETADPAFRNLGPAAPALAGVNVNTETLGSYAPYLA